MDRAGFVHTITADIESRAKHNKTSVEKLALKFGIDDKNQVKELTELAIVNIARKLVHAPGNVQSRYERIVELYQSQVNLSHRTSQSIMLQQYSTPAPIAYLMGVFCGIDKLGNYFEPSAGNGLLTIAGLPQHFTVNEIDPVRRSNLGTQNFLKVLGMDATNDWELNSNFYRNFDAVLTNPPFGRLDKPVSFDSYPIKELDHLMAIRALDTLKDNGRAAIIIGGHTTWDEQGRIQAGKNRVFFSYLHSHYHVLDTLQIDGQKLYSRQGTAFDVRLILIAGRKTEVGGHPPHKQSSDTVIDNFEELYERVMKYTPVQKETSDVELEALALETELELLKL